MINNTMAHLETRSKIPNYPFKKQKRFHTSKSFQTLNATNARQQHSTQHSCLISIGCDSQGSVLARLQPSHWETAYEQKSRWRELLRVCVSLCECHIGKLSPAFLAFYPRMHYVIQHNTCLIWNAPTTRSLNAPLYPPFARKWSPDHAHFWQWKHKLCRTFADRTDPHLPVEVHQKGFTGFLWPSLHISPRKKGKERVIPPCRDGLEWNACHSGPLLW